MMTYIDRGWEQERDSGRNISCRLNKEREEDGERGREVVHVIQRVRGKQGV